MYKLVCMAWDGDCITDRENFDTPDEAWEYEADMGSKWFFYPFHFVVNENDLTVKDSPEGMEYMNGRELSVVSDFFEAVSAFPEALEMEIIEYASLLYTVWHEALTLDKALDKE